MIAYDLDMNRSKKRIIKGVLTLGLGSLLLYSEFPAAKAGSHHPIKSPHEFWARKGETFFNHTPQLLKKYARSELSCSSCHLRGGQKPFGASLVGVYNHYPRYQARAGRVVTFPERINGCFVRSLNGKPLPPDGDEMKAFVAYMRWLSRNVPTGEKARGSGLRKIKGVFKTSLSRGRILYIARCARCHGRSGQGVVGADGRVFVPPVWGRKSFNLGAGMARLSVAAAFIKWNMPKWQGGTLSSQQSYDIADYLIHQPRPDFSGKNKDWPKGGKPADARY